MSKTIRLHPDEHPHLDDFGWSPPNVGALTAVFTNLEVIRLLAQGGMSAVYLAKQPWIDRLVVIKLINSEVWLSDPDLSKRFLNEARALAKLADPGIVEILEAGQNALGLFLILTYEAGGDLAQWSQSDQKTQGAALSLIGALSRAVSVAHEAGLVHGDIKPDNVFLDAKGRPKLGDFGLIQDIGQGKASFFSPGYTAPEVINGGELTVKSDIYSLGATLLSCLTGETPPSDAVELEAQVGRQPKVVAHVLRAALAADPTQRLATAAEFRQALLAAEKGVLLPLQQATSSRHEPSQRTSQSKASTTNTEAQKESSKIPVLIGLAATFMVGGWLWHHFSTNKAPVRTTIGTPSITQTPQVKEAQQFEPVATTTVSNQADESWMTQGQLSQPQTNAAKVSAPSYLDEIKAWNPEWTIDAPLTGHDKAHFEASKEDGQRVIVLMPFTTSKPCSITKRQVELNSEMILSVRVAAHLHKVADWLLSLKVDGQLVGDVQVISSTAATQRFQTIEWDLSPWKGKRVDLQLEGAGGGPKANWNMEHGSWAWIKLLPKVTTDPVKRAELPPIAKATLDKLDDFVAQNQTGLASRITAMRKTYAGQLRQQIGANPQEKLDQAKLVESLPVNELPVPPDVWAMIAEPANNKAIGEWKYHFGEKLAQFRADGTDGTPFLHWRWLSSQDGVFIVTYPGKNDHIDLCRLFTEADGDTKVSVRNETGDPPFIWKKMSNSGAPENHPLRDLAQQEYLLRREVEESITTKRKQVVAYLRFQASSMVQVERTAIEGVAKEIERLYSPPREMGFQWEGRWRTGKYEFTFAPNGELLIQGEKSGRWMWAHPQGFTIAAISFNGINALARRRTSNPNLLQLTTNQQSEQTLEDAALVPGSVPGLSSSPSAQPTQQVASAKQASTPLFELPPEAVENKTTSPISAQESNNDSPAKPAIPNPPATKSTSIASPPVRPKDVPAHAIHHNGKWYAFFKGDVNQGLAERECARWNGSLAIIPDQAAWQAVKNLVSGQQAWLGANDSEYAGGWRWDDGSLIDGTLLSLIKSASTNSRNNYLITQPDGTWGSVNPSGHRDKIGVTGYLCQWPKVFHRSGLIPALDSTSPPPRPGRVPEGAIYHNGSWFALVQSKDSWLTSQKECKKSGGRLAVIPDQKTWDKVRPLCVGKQVWLGASDWEKEGKWVWEDGTLFTPESFHPWAFRQPNNFGGRENHLITFPDGWWNDATREGRDHGVAVQGYICEWTHQ